MVSTTAALVFAFLVQSALHLAPKQVKERAPTYTILITYPEIPGSADFNPPVHNIVDSLVDRFKSDVAIALLSGAPSARAYLRGSYTSAALKSGIVSVLLQWEQYHPPAAHPSGGMASIPYYTKANRVLALSDLFLPGINYVSRLSQVAMDSLKRRQDAHQDLIRQGAGPVEDNFKVFTLSETSLVLHFPTYQVGTRVDGSLEVAVPLETLRPLLRK